MSNPAGLFAYNRGMTKLARIRRIGTLLAMCLMAVAVVFAVGCGQKAAPDDSGTSAPAGQEQAADQGTEPGNGAQADDPGGGSGSSSPNAQAAASIDEDGSYTSKEDVALYIHTYGHLPGNFISKSKAKKAGWVAKQGNLDEVCPGMSMGGSQFYNDEGQLPDKNGRTWTECDINYHGGYRGEERIVFSNDGLIFYTDDHYQTFEQLY